VLCSGSLGSNSVPCSRTFARVESPDVGARPLGSQRRSAGKDLRLARHLRHSAIGSRPTPPVMGWAAARRRLRARSAARRPPTRSSCTTASGPRAARSCGASLRWERGSPRRGFGRRLGGPAGLGLRNPVGGSGTTRRLRGCAPMGRDRPAPRASLTPRASLPRSPTADGRPRPTGCGGVADADGVHRGHRDGERRLPPELGWVGQAFPCFDTDASPPPTDALRRVRDAHGALGAPALGEGEQEGESQPMGPASSLGPRRQT
jgi:hypothetical protein